MKKIFYGITLIIGIGICLALLFFPVLEFNREAIYKHHKEEIEEAIKLDDSSKSYEEKKEEAINEIIYNTAIILQMYKRQSDVVFDEDGNAIETGSDTESMMFDIYALKESGIKYTDIANSIKNQFNWDVSLYRALKTQGKVDMKVFFANWSNPMLMILILILIAFEFSCGIILIVRSIRGVQEKKRNKVLIISICGVGSTLLFMSLGLIFRTNQPLEELSTINDFVRLFAMSVKGTKVCIYCGIGFMIATGLGIITKFIKD